MITGFLVIAGLGFIVAAWGFLQEIGWGFSSALESAGKYLFIYTILIVCLAIVGLSIREIINSRGNYLIDKPYLSFISVGFIVAAWGFLQELEWGFDKARENALKYIVSYVVIVACFAIAGFVLYTALSAVFTAGEKITEEVSKDKTILTLSIIGVFIFVFSIISILLIRFRDDLLDHSPQPSHTANFHETDEPIVSRKIYQGSTTAERVYNMHREALKEQYQEYVYVMDTKNGFYKIGFTSSPEKRIKAVDRDIPVKVEYFCLIKTHDMRSLEKKLHIQFADKRREGEWFELDEEDLKYLITLSDTSQH